MSGRDAISVLAAASGSTLLYFDPRHQRIKLPTQDSTACLVDGRLVLATATPMADLCEAKQP